MPFFRHRVSGPGSAGDTWTTGLHASGSGSLDDSHAAWVTLVTDFIGDTLGAMWKTTTKATSITTDVLDGDGLHAIGQKSSVVNLVGTGVGGGTSPRDCIVIGLRTAIPQRSGRGRMFWPGPDATHYLPSGLFVAADVDTIASGFYDVLNVFRGTNNPVVLHRGHDAPIGDPFGVVPSTVDNVVSIKVGNIPGTQRRRTNKIVNSYSTEIL